MALPFTTEQFFDVFERYNTDLPFAGLVLSVAACCAVILSFTRLSKFSFFILAFLWIWAGAAYHIAYFTSVNPLAWGFGAAFILQGLFLSFFALKSEVRDNNASWNLRRFGGVILMFFAIVVYPFLSGIFGHEYPRSPTFGHPCPLTIFTFGLLLAGSKSVPLYVIIIPIVWSMIGTSASILFGVWQDLTLLASAFVFVVLSIMTRGKSLG